MSDTKYNQSINCLIEPVTITLSGVFKDWAAEVKFEQNKMNNLKYDFWLNPKEEETIEKIKEAVKLLYGEEGAFSFTFSPTSVGTIVKVFSHKGNCEMDITDDSRLEA